MRTDFLPKAAFAARENVRNWLARYGSPESGEYSPKLVFLPKERPGCGVIAEVKMRSPSRGDLMGGSDPCELAARYQESGAEAISIVVEEKYFGGSPELFESVRDNTKLPLFWKDFVVDPFQIRLAAALGASAVLLIVGLVPDDELSHLIDLARGEGLSPLVEVHCEGDLARALAAGADLVGVNNRNLVSLEVDTRVSEEVLSRFPEGLRAVSESGLKSPEDVYRIAGLGYREFLVGEALVTADDPGGLLE